MIETRNEGEGGKKWIGGKRTGDAAVSVRERERERGRQRCRVIKSKIMVSDRMK